MKLKQALKIAKKRGFNFVAVDSNGVIYAHGEEPQQLRLGWCDRCWDYIRLGVYTGSKNWKNTLRGVKL